jgi:hypothetical protein
MIKVDILDKLRMLKSEKLGALSQSFNELRSEAGLARGAWNVSRLDRTALVLHDVDLGAEALSGGAAGYAGVESAKHLFGGHGEGGHGEGGHEGGEGQDTRHNG